MAATETESNFSAKTRRALFIGSFDPLTWAHLEVVKAGLRQLQVEEVVFLVNSASGKDYSASVQERVEMLRLAARSELPDPLRFVVLPEPPEGKRNFAISLAKKSQEGVVFQIAGDDVQAKAQELFQNLEAVKTYILPRLDSEGKTAPLAKGFHELKIESPSNLSSTLVKQFRLSGKSIEGLVPPAILQSIEARGLYRPLSPQQWQIRQEKIRQQVQLLKTAAVGTPFESLNFETLQSVLQTTAGVGSVSTQTNLQLSSLQSEEAVEELLARRLVAGNKALSATEGVQVRKWAEGILKMNRKAKSPGLCQTLLTGLR